MIRKYLARAKRKFLKQYPLRDPSVVSFWFQKHLGNTEAFVVQIGSNDGKTGDPIFPLFQKNKRWKGLLVEPVPYLYERLKENYSDRSRFLLENSAINQGEDLDFFWVRADANQKISDLPFWYDQLGSFDREHIINELGSDVEPFVDSKKLPGIRFPDLLEKHGVKRVDILHIDTEGYDWKILGQLELQKFTPSFILFEANHLTGEEVQAALDFLNSEYDIFESGIDVIAIRKDIQIKKSTFVKYFKEITP